MKNSIREEIVKHPAKKLFDIVIDIESYPEYIPWCTRMVVNERKDSEISVSYTHLTLPTILLV